MVEFNLVAGLIAGFVGTVVMTLLMNASKAAGMTNMPPMPLVMGNSIRSTNAPAGFSCGWRTRRPTRGTRPTTACGRPATNNVSTSAPR
jgi:hypothetical protein